MPSLPIPTDPVEIRAYIKHDVFLKKPVFEGYKDMCKIIPEFDYPEYDYWYYRFLAGNPDLNYDRSVDPKPLKLEELPVDALSKILEKVDVKNRFKIRKLSKTMLSVVDQLKTAYEKIEIAYCQNFSSDVVNVRVEVRNSSWQLRYFPTRNGCEVGRNYRCEEIVGENFMKIALHDLGIIMRPTKIRVENFEIRVRNSNGSRQIVDLLVSISKTANFKFHVKSAEIETWESNLALSVLSAMKPGVLEILEIGYNSYDEEPELFDMNQIKDMEQFKQAKNVDLSGFGIIQSTDLALFLGYEEFNVCVKSMKPEDVICLRNDLSQPDDTIFKRCSIRLHIPFTTLVEIGGVLGKHVRNERVRYMQHCCSIADSEKVLKFSIHKDEIVIEKIDPTPDQLYSYSDDSGPDYFDSDDDFLW